MESYSNELSTFLVRNSNKWTPFWSTAIQSVLGQLDVKDCCKRKTHIIIYILGFWAKISSTTRQILFKRLRMSEPISYIKKLLKKTTSPYYILTTYVAEYYQVNVSITHNSNTLTALKKFGKQNTTFWRVFLRQKVW